METNAFSISVVTKYLGIFFYRKHRSVYWYYVCTGAVFVHDSSINWPHIVKAKLISCIFKLYHTASQQKSFNDLYFLIDFCY